jgi:hypothetical protein
LAERSRDANAADHGKASVVDAGAPPDEEQQLRELAVEQPERKRRFRMHAISYAAVCVVLIVIWAITEYSNAGGWPTNGFSQSSSIPHEWNIWIIYPGVGADLRDRRVEHVRAQANN